jgi:hypothetical protein
MPQLGPIVCAVSSWRSPRPLLYKFNISTVAEKLTTLYADIQKVGAQLMISGRIRTLYSQSDFRGKN